MQKTDCELRGILIDWIERYIGTLIGISSLPTHSLIVLANYTCNTNERAKRLSAKIAHLVSNGGA